jgi:hypothetical protein
VVTEPSPRASAPPLSIRIGIATVLALIAAWECYRRLGARPELNALDFTYPWRAAVHLLAGRDPYLNMPHAPYTQGGPFLYPLPTAMLIAPLAHWSVRVAASAFTSVSVGLLAFALTSRAYWPLLMLLSAPFWLALWNVQWSMLLIAASLLPGIGWLGVAKPNLGIVVFAHRPRWSTALGAIALLAAGLLVNTSWPREWLEHLRLQPSAHPPALLWPFGFVGLVGLLRWRTPEGRVLAAMTIAPSSAWFYDQLFLMLVARTWKQSLVLSAISWVAFILVLATQAPINLIDPERARGVQRILILGTYLPAAILVLRQPNAGALPAWHERRIASLPRFLRGTSIPSEPRAPSEPAPSTSGASHT